MAARTAPSHAKMSGKKIIGLLLNNKSIFLIFFILFVWPVVSCYEVLELKINAAIVRIIQSGRSWLVVLCMLIGQRFLVPCGLCVTQTNLQFCFSLYWGVEESAVRPQQDPRRRFHPPFLSLPPPTFASLVLPQFTFSSPSDAKTRRLTSGFPCERVSLGGGGGRGSEKEKIPVTRQWCWKSSNKSAITTELWRNWLEQVVTNKPTHKPLVILEANKQIRPDAS